MPAKNPAHEIQKVTWVGVFVNIFLAAGKFFVGTVGHSQALIADAVHSLSDLTTDMAILVGARFWTAPADQKHPYGHQRIETLISAFIGFILGGTAIGLAWNAIVSFKTGVFSQPAWPALVGALMSIVIKEILYRWTLKRGERLKSSAVIANAWHHRSDAISSLPAAIAVGLAMLNPKLSFFDPVGALLVSVIILRVAWKIIGAAFSYLIDTAASTNEQQTIQKLALSIPAVKSAHKIRTRYIGSCLFVDMHVEVDGNLTVFEGHAITEQVELTLRQNGPNIKDVVVHLEPYPD